MVSNDFDKNDQKKEMLFNEDGQLNIGDGKTHETFDTPNGSPDHREKPHSGVNLAHKIAASILLINSVILILEMIFMSETPVNGGESVGGIFGSIVVGIMLLSGNPKGPTWARIAVVIGAVVFTIQAIAQQDIFTAVFQLFFSASLILLLFGSPMKKRIITSVIMASVYFLLAILGLAMEITGDDLFLTEIAEAGYDLSDLPNNTLKGNACPYTLVFPEKGNWRSLSHKQVLVESPDADNWVMDALADAHVLVIVEELDFDVDTLTDIVMKNGSELLDNFTVARRWTVQTSSGLEGRAVVASGNSDGVAIGYKYGLFTDGGRAYQIICFTGKESYPQLEESFSSIISSFVPAPGLPVSP